MNYVGNIENYFDELKKVIDSVDKEQIDIAIKKLIEVYSRNGFIYTCGNGGSASTASHFVNDFNKGISEELVKRYKCICLNDNTSTLMAVANDISFNDIFEFQLKNYLGENDLVLAISGSGNSENILRAVEYANGINADTIAFVGFDGGKLKKCAKYSIHVPVYNMQIVEDVHMSLVHLMVSVIKKYLKRGEELDYQSNAVTDKLLRGRNRHGVLL